MPAAEPMLPFPISLRNSTIVGAFIVFRNSALCLAHGPSRNTSSNALFALGSPFHGPAVGASLRSGMSRGTNIVLQVPLALDLMVRIGSVLTSCVFCVVFAGSGMIWRVKTAVFMGFWAYCTAYSLLHSPPPWAQSLLWPDTSTHLTPTLANYSFPAMSSEYSNLMGFLANSFVGIPLACSWSLPKYGLNVT